MPAIHGQAPAAKPARVKHRSPSSLKTEIFIARGKRIGTEILNHVPPCHFQRVAFPTTAVLQMAALKVLAEGALQQSLGWTWSKIKIHARTSQRRERGEDSASEQSPQIPTGLLPFLGSLPAALPRAALSQTHLLAGSFVNSTQVQ